MAVVVLFVFMIVVLMPFLPGRIAEAPVSPGNDTPVRYIYVYDTGYAVEYPGKNISALAPLIGVSGKPIAEFVVYPGGYRCNGSAVRIGTDPYTGLWCPPPIQPRSVSGCTPIGVTSQGRFIIVQYAC